MRLFILCCSLACAGALPGAETITDRSGDWLLINGLVVLNISDDGTMTLRNSGVKGKITLAPGGTFTWQIPDQPVSQGKFTGDILQLKNDQANSPRWLQFLEFRKSDKETANEVIEVALQQQTATTAALAKVRQNSTRISVLNNLRQLAAAADQYFLENGTSKARFEQLVGEDKYIRQLEPVDGEDYTKLNLNQDNSELKVVTASGVIVNYSR